jgi:hypothetical protein
LLVEKGRANQAQVTLSETANELSRFRRLSPFPKGANLGRTRAEMQAYGSSLFALKNELKSGIFPTPALLPNEFQTALRLAINSVNEGAAAGKVQLPVDFSLGFDEYASSLPNSEAAPQLGRQLRAIEWITHAIIDAHVDRLTSLTRTSLAVERLAPTPTPGPTRKPVPKSPGASSAALAKERIVDSTSVDIGFSGSPAAARRVLNQIASAKDQFYIIRTLVIRNQVDKGPKRGGTETSSGASERGPADLHKDQGNEQVIHFIVGTEHLDVTARIEIVTFFFPEKNVR